MNRILFLFCTVICIVSFSFSSLQAGSECNPADKSMRVAYGDMDLFTDHLFMAIAFFNNCPIDWIKKRVHVDLQDSSLFYYDKGIIQTGNDTDSSQGVDVDMLFFHTGHGHPDAWTASPSASTIPPQYFAELNKVRLGNCPESNGRLRYFWQCACNVFAHGAPRQRQDGTNDYIEPESFSGTISSPDRVCMRNVYQRWNDALGPDLRMACGVSSLAWCTQTAGKKMWDGYPPPGNSSGYQITDNFIDALEEEHVQEVPLCIARGDSDVAKTPLFDPDFTNNPNEAGNGFWLHIQFRQEYQKRGVVIPPIPPLLAAVYQLTPLRIPPIFKKPPPLPDPPDPGPLAYSALLSKRPNLIRNVHSRRYPVSGAIYFSGRLKFDPRKGVLDKAVYISRAKQFMKKLGMMEQSITGPRMSRMMLQSIPVKGTENGLRQTQKNFTVTFRRKVRAEGKWMPVIGDGGVIRVRMNTDGSMLNASKVWREIVGPARMVKVKPYEEAYKEALKTLGKPEAYGLYRWVWGYEELGGSIKQDEMRIVYYFYFMPKEKTALYSPRKIAVLAQVD